MLHIHNNFMNGFMDSHTTAIPGRVALQERALCIFLKINHIINPFPFLYI